MPVLRPNQLHVLATQRERVLILEHHARPVHVGIELVAADEPIVIGVVAIEVSRRAGRCLVFGQAIVAVAIDAVARPGRLRKRRPQVLPHVLVRDECRGVFEDAAATGVVVMEVALNHPLHGLAWEAGRELALQPRRHFRAQRIGEDDAIRRDEKYGDGRNRRTGIHLIEVGRDLRDRSHRRRRSLPSLLRTRRG